MSGRDSSRPSSDDEAGDIISERLEMVTSGQHQQNAGLQNVQQFAEAFEIQTEIDKLEWFRSVKIDPWTNRFTKDGKIAEDMEKTYWDQEARYHQQFMAKLTTACMVFNFFVLLCDLHPKYMLTDTPKVVKMRDIDEVLPFLVGARLLIFFVLLFAKVTKFFVGPDCGFIKSKWKVMVGMSIIQITEMALAMFVVDEEPGMHCIVILIMFNFTPQRLVEKAPLCIATYLIWAFTYLYYASTWQEDDQYKELWAHPKINEGFFMDKGCTLCYSVINLLTTTACFMAVQIYVVFNREEYLSENLLAIKIGEVQSTIISKRNKTNQMLLDSMLPQEITKELGQDNKDLTYVESYTDVTVLFCMIDNFGEISSTFDAIELVSILNGVYSCFDDLADNFGSIYKVETVGEVYMMAGGCPRRAVTHATDAAEMALAMIRVMPDVKTQIKDTIFGKDAQGDRLENGARKMEILDNLNIKVGLNTGQVTAGVIGATCQRFKLFGDTVNTASRMESNSLPNKITISASTFKQLIKAKNFLFLKRDPMPVKGKGIVQTYFLQGMASDNNSKISIEHDSLHDLVSREDQIKFNFVEVCKQAIQESQAKDGGHGDMDAFSKALEDDAFREGLEIESDGNGGYFENPNDAADQVDETDATNNYYSKMLERLQSRAKPQLPMNQTLLFLLGYEFHFVKPDDSEAMLEAHYRLHVFSKEKRLIRTIFFFFLFSMVFLLVYDLWGLNHDTVILLIRYSISIPFLAVFLCFTYHNTFFYYQQTALSLPCMIFGITLVIMGTYKAPYPGYGMCLITFLLIFNLDSLFFLNRVGIVLSLTILYTVCLNLFCVAYNNINNHLGGDDNERLAPTMTDNALKLNLSTIADNFCLLQGDSNGTELVYHNFFSNDAYNFEGPMDKAIYQSLWTCLENRQQVAPMRALQQIILVFYFVCLLVFPSWVSHYFSRVCFNRVQRGYEMEKENKATQTRTREYLERLVPASIVPKLSHGKFIADRLDDVSILFVDMVGFTKFSSQLDPDELVMFLNEMYSNFDVVLEKYCLYKVEIIGDALFAVAGAPEDRYDKYHAARCVCAANGLLKEIIKLRNFLEISIRIRVGIHTGSCVAGVVGIKDPRYHLFGITSNYAEKMESTGAAGRVHVSQATVDSITKSGASKGFTFTKREIDDLVPLPEDASEEKKNKRQATIDNISEAKSRVGGSYFAEVDDESVMTFPNLLQESKSRRSTKEGPKTEP